jgi:biotin transport system substrate-specific component
MPQTLALVLTQPLQIRSKVLNDVLLVVGGSLLVAASAQLSVLLPFTPVPVTGQTFAVMLVAAALGSKRGTAALALYLAEGFSGLPFFATAALGPSLGYLLGFLPAAYLVGFLAERGMDRSWGRAVLTFSLGNAVIFALGLAWLSRWVSSEQLLVAGFWPFLPGEAVKVLLAAASLPVAWAWVRRN